MKRITTFSIALLLCATVTAVFFFTRARAASTYTWNQTGTAAWTLDTNWTPARTTPAADDILVFNNAATTTVTGVPTQTIGQLTVSGNTTVNLQSAGAVALTIAGGAGTDLDVQAGSALNLNAINVIAIGVGGGATGSISGSMTFSASASTAHRLTAVDPSGITFNSGATFTAGTNFNGNAFGTTSLNSVIFANGSTYVAIAGSNPFGAGQPSSVVVFQSGSLFSVQSNNTPSFSGRTYANVEINSAAANLTVNGGAAVNINNLTITAGTLNFGMTATPGHSIKGNISVASGATLNFNPATAGTLNLNGASAQTISGAGTLTTTANQTFVVAASSSVTINRPFTLAGTMTVNSGGTLATGDTFTNNGTTNINGTFQINQGGSATGNNFVYNAATGTLRFNNSAGSFAVSGTPVYWPASSGPQNVSVQGSGGITMSVARTVSTLFQYAAGVSGAGNLTLTGTTQINTGGFVSGSPTYGGVSSLLKYNTGGTYNRNGEWLPGATSGAGYPTHVQLSNNTTLDLVNGSNSPYQMSGDLTIDTGSTMQLSLSTLTNPLTIFGSVNNNGTLNLSNAAGGDVNVGGSWNNNGTFNANGRTVNFNGSIGQAISGNSTFFNLTKNTAVAQTLTFAALSTQTVTNNLTLNGAAGNLLSLRSNTPGTQWKLNVLGAQSISFVDVQDSDASGGVTVTPTSAVDSGNNLNWAFGAADYNVTVSGPAIVVDDVSGNSDTLTISEPGFGTIKFAAPSRTFSINGGPLISGDSGTLLIPTSSITVHAAGGNDIINVGAFTTPLPGVGIGGGAGDDTVNFNGNLTFDVGRDLSVDLQTDPIPGTDTVNFAPGVNVALTGTGPLSVKASKTITFGAGSKLQVQNGNLVLEANQQGTPTVGDFNGVDIIGGTVQTTGTGNISIKGTGGAGDFIENVGVLVSTGGQVKSTGAGTISVQGTGGNGSGSATSGGSSLGVYVTLAGSQIISSSSAITVTGTGGTTTDSNVIGITLDELGTIETDGAGTLTITGTGGTVTGGGSPTFVNSGGIFITPGDVNGDGGLVKSTGTGANAGAIVINGTATNGGNGAAQGVRVDNPGSVTTVDGNISITGTSAACSNACLGTSIRGSVTASGSGGINVTGTGGVTNGAFPVHGVNVRSNGASNGLVSTTTGNIVITGTGGTGSTSNDNAGVNIAPSGIATVSTSGSGTITINTDSFRIPGAAAANILANASSVTLRQKTNGTLIDLGSALDTTPNTLELSSQEIQHVFAGTINFGDLNSGNLTVSSNISPISSANLVLTSGANINISGGSVGSSGGNVTLVPGAGANVFPSKSGVDVSLTSTKTLSLTSSKDLKIVINSTTVDTGYTQLNVAGLVNLNNASLALSGLYVPVAGDSFIIVNNDSTDAITGTFNGLPEGAVIPNFLGSGLNASITYVGGSGNDAVLTVVSSAETSAAVSGGNLVITDVNGGTSNDALTISLNGANVRVTDPGNAISAGAGAIQVNANTIEVPLASISGNIQVNTLAGDDSLTLNFSGGNFLPAGGLNYAGGTETSSPGDKLAIVGGSQGTVTYNYANLNDGNIVMSAYGTVTYTGLEPISNTGSATDIIFNMPPSGALAFLEDDGVPANSMSRLRSAGAFETTDFANPTGSVTINGATSGDMFALDSPTDFTAGLAIGTIAHPFNLVAFNGPLSLAANKSLSVEATSQINIGGPIQTSTISTTGTGAISMNGRNIIVGPAAGSSLSVVNGNMTLTANTAGTATGNASGINLGATALTTTGSGNISLTGKGLNDAGTAQHNGITVNGGSTISSTSAAAGAGTITLNGTGGTGATFNPGVIITQDNSTVSSNHGDISITGQGGAGGSGAHGVTIIQGALVSGTNGAKINLNGTGGTGTNQAFGVVISSLSTNNNFPRVTSDSGDITIIGQGGSGTGLNHAGVSVDTSGRVTATGAANVSITGTGGTGTTDNYGIQVDGGNRAGTGITAVNGNIAITGTATDTTGTNQDGVQLGDSVAAQAVAINVTGNGQLTITGTAGNTDPSSSGINIFDDCTMALSGATNSFIADTMDIGNSNVSVNAGANALTLRPLTNNRAINLGGADSAAQLGITDGELDVIAAGTINIGNTNSGAITVSAPITRPTASNLVLTSGANIDLVSSLNSNGGDVTLLPATNNFPSGSGVDVTTSPSKTLTLAALKNLTISISSTTVDTGYTQLNVAGLVNLNNAQLAVSGSYVPVGGETFIVVNNDGADPITGTFNSLPEGAIIPNFLGSGRPAKITYIGGSGNDAVITVIPCPTTLTVNSNGDAGDASPGDGNCLTALGACTLRAAIQEANASGSCGTININFGIPSSTINVATELQLSHAMNINGPTAASITVAATPSAPTRVFNVLPGQTVSLSNLTVTGGRAGIGGGLMAQGPSSNTTLTGMLFTGNTAIDPGGVAGGGGVATINGGTLNIINSTVSGNTGTNGGGILILGGGPLNLVNATVTNNNADGNTGSGPCPTAGSVDGDGGGIGGPTMPVSGISLRNSIVTGNQDCNSNNPNITVAGGFNNLGNNLTSGNSLLGPLQNNGGPTLTHALLALSPAIDAGNDCVLANACVPAVGFNITTDQRGFPRPAAGSFAPAHVDIGAFEKQTPSAADSTVAGRIVDGNGDPVAGAAVRMRGTQNRMVMTDSEGNYRFAEVEAGGFYTITPTRPNFSFAPVERTFSQLGQQTEALFTAAATSGFVNPLDTSEFFVRAQYLDFLGREPDEAGLNFWVTNIDSCGAAANCLAAKRVDTSAAFFLSIEFHETGYLVYRLHQSAFGELPGAPVPVNFADFRADTAVLGAGLVVNAPGWQDKLEANKQAFIAAFVTRARFASAYPSLLTPAAFVDRLIANAGVGLDANERAAAIAEFGTANNSADTAARARALRRVAESGALDARASNSAFVLLQYFGYLGRDPNALPDGNFSGYDFWLNKLESFAGDFRRAEMVRAFLVAGEYRERFPR